MPTYEYLCPEGHQFEVVQKMSDRPRAKCPRCGRMAERQMSGGAGLIFKGSGFYITDYGKDGKGPRKDSESEPKKQPETTAAEPGKEAPASKPAADKSDADKPTKKKAKPSE